MAKFAVFLTNEKIVYVTARTNMQAEIAVDNRQKDAKSPVRVCGSRIVSGIQR